MRKVATFVLVLLGVMVASLMLAEWFELSVTVMVLMATVGSLFCLLALIIVPRSRKQAAEREYQRLVRDGMDSIVGRAHYRGRRVLHYADGSVAVQTSNGMQAFENFDACRQFVDGR